MTAILRHHPASMSSVASHVYPNHSKHPHFGQPQYPTTSEQAPPNANSQYLQSNIGEFSTARNVNDSRYAPDGQRTMGYGASRAVDAAYVASSAQYGAPQRSIQQKPQPQTYSMSSQVDRQPAERNSSNTAQPNLNNRTRARSPIEEVSPKHVEFKQEPDMYQPDSKDQIAPYLQIPMEISSSKGSLPDFASQIICLFWFESSQTLLRVEEAQTIPSPQPLLPEAIPSMGFRKWVTTILSTTQVSTNVVLLALMFVYRLKKMNASVKGKPGSEYRLLTVALMLGNKFLDDNTYTNKTWAEVSGITVNEIHVMEVEFLSNMRYTLYCSKEEWLLWLQKLRRFSDYFTAASRAAEQMQMKLEQKKEQTMAIPMPVHPMMSGHGPIPGTMGSSMQQPMISTRPYGMPNQQMSTPVALLPHPMQHQQIMNQSGQLRMPEPDLRPTTRKRSYEDSTMEHPSKRISRNLGIGNRPDMQSSIQPMGSAANSTIQELPTPRSGAWLDSGAPRLPLPVMNNQQMLPQSNRQMHPQFQQNYTQMQPISQLQQISQGRAMASVYSTNQQPGMEMLQPQPRMQPALGLRIPSLIDTNQSMSTPGSITNSPMTSIATPTGDMLSPMVYGNYRSSPYKPVRSVNSLLAPPPSTSLGNPANGIDSSDLQYRPLGKQPGQSRIGVVPHIPLPYSQNQWHHPHPQGY